MQLLLKYSSLYLLISLGLFSAGLRSQNFGPAVDAFAESLSEKSTSPLAPYISPDLKFDPIPADKTAGILQNIVNNLPRLNSITIVETTAKTAKIKYDFEALGESESYIHFDAEGKILRIELIEFLIQQELTARKASVQLPAFDGLAEKYLPTRVEFTAADGLLISGNLYEVGLEQPVILLCHQANTNRIEYADIAPKLNELGYNCLAIDQRFGGDLAGKPNLTAQRAQAAGQQPAMHEAQQDLKAAIHFLHKKYQRPVIVWGSSYSASLALFEGRVNEEVSAIIAFSPGDYFQGATASLEDVFMDFKKPFFVTSSRVEAATLSQALGNKKEDELQLQFIPEGEGLHGSKALWTGQKDEAAYWQALLSFLNQLD